MPLPFVTSLVQMRDERYVCVVECGDPDGVPAFYFHGAPASRIGGLLFHDAAKASGVRLLVPDRPGMGFSEPKPGRRVLDWADDVEDMADTYGLRRFAVFGASGGGPYALAAAARLDERVAATVVASGIGPLADQPEMMAGFNKTARRFIRLGMSRKSTLRVAVKLMTKESKQDGKNKFTELTVDELPGSDAQTIAWINAHPHVQSESAEVQRQGLKYAAADLACILSPWGFRLTDIVGHVSLWHGDTDPAVPAAVAMRSADLIPDSELHLVPGGHQIPITYRDDIFRELATTTATATTG